MKDLSNATRIDNTDPDYLNGKLVDGANGTLIDTVVNQDVIQFFQKLMSLAGLTANDQFDNESNGYQLIQALYNVVNAGTKPKIIPIGDWNMDTTTTVAVAHGLDFTKIRSIQVFIRNDDNDELYPLDFHATATDTNIYYARTSDVFLGRADGGYFDGVDFDSTSYNRGWIIIDYVA